MIRSISFVWGLSLGIFRLKTDIWDVLVRIFLCDLSFGICRVGSFVLAISLVCFVWDVGLKFLAWDLSFGIVRLGSVVWDLELRL